MVMYLVKLDAVLFGAVNRLVDKKLHGCEKVIEKYKDDDQKKINAAITTRANMIRLKKALDDSDEIEESKKKEEAK